MPEAIWLLSFVTAQRLGELVLARRHTALLLLRGGIEYGAGHYPLIVALHSVWLAGLWTLAYDRPIDGGWLAAFAALQVARIWVLTSLGRRWTTRIIVLPDAPRVTHGPYQFLHHPNYAVVAGEMAVIPLALGMPVFAGLFSALNLMVTAWRIRVENAALAQNSPTAQTPQAAPE
jgi:methyltransferase